MKRVHNLGVVLLLFVSLCSTPAEAADSTTCESGSQINRLDPPLNPNGSLGNGTSLSTSPITGFKASKSDDTSVYATWDRWNPGNVGALEIYYLYVSSNGGSTWSCTRSYGLSAQISGLVSGVEIQAILLARKGDTWAKSQIVKVSPVQTPSAVCPSKNYEFRIEYNEVLKGFFLVMMPGQTSADPNSENFAGNNQRAQFINYKFEATVDNWKSKVIGKNSVGSTSFGLGQGVWIKPLDSKKLHTFRAIPMASELSPMDTSSCIPFTKSLLPKAKKADPCAISVLDPECKQEVVAGENTAEQAQESPTTSKSVKSINCQKGKLFKKVNGINPKCPAGYKKKQGYP